MGNYQKKDKKRDMRCLRCSSVSRGIPSALKCGSNCRGKRLTSCAKPASTRLPILSLTLRLGELSREDTTKKSLREVVIQE
jgi:hypothetical protein